MSDGESRVRVLLPKSLRQFWEGPESVDLDGGTLDAVLARLNERYPGLGARILDDQGRPRRFVLVFVNRDPVAHLPPSEVALSPGDVVHILPSVAGGA